MATKEMLEQVTGEVHEKKKKDKLFFQSKFHFSFKESRHILIIETKPLCVSTIS